jgi:class 3 adenylate cyclase
MFALSAWSATAFLILWRRSRDLFGILLFVCFASAGVIGSTDVFEILRMQRTDIWAPLPALVMYAANALCILWVFVFPDGRFVPQWARAFAIAWVAWNALRAMLSAADIAAIGHHAIAINFLLLASAVASLVFRYHRYASEVERNQLKWLLLGCIFALIVYATISVIIAVPSLQQPGTGFLLRVGSTALMSLAMVAVPAVMLVAIFRQALLDVDRLINRTLLYAALTALTIAAFLLINTALRHLIEQVIGQASELLAIVLALPLAIAVLPVRRRLGALLDNVLKERTVLTVMFIDIVDSTTHAVRLGDQGWSDLLQAFRSLVRSELSSYGGEEVDTAGDGFFATFVGPGGAIHCAAHIAAAVQQLGVSVRVGLHTGEVDRYGVGVTGIAVHVGARIMSLAAANEVVVSAALRDLVAGSRIGMRDLGEHPLKGLPGVFRVYAVRPTLEFP